MESPVAYECVASSHLVGEGGPDKLTIHQGQWAFCPYDVKAEGHQWKATGGVPLSLVRRSAGLRRTEPARDRGQG